MLRRKLAPIFIVLTFGLVAIGSSAVPQQSCRSDIASLRPDDRPIPIPWSVRLPFPWDIAQGVWFAEKGEFQSFFSFKVVTSKSSKDKQIIVRQIDSVTCDIIAQGTGVATNRILYAQMRNIVDGRVYSLSLTSFEADDLPKQLASKPIDGKSMLLSISVVNGQAVTHYLGIQKVSTKWNYTCKSSESSYE